MTRHRFPKPYADLVARMRVPSGFLLVILFAWLADPTTASLAWGVPVSLSGLWIRGWAAGHLAKNRELARSGPYAHVRNPLYIGTLLVAAGLVVAARRWELAAAFGFFFGLVYLPVIELEEQHLSKLFDNYGDYTRSVPMLWPRLRRTGGPEKFRWSLFMRNQEYQAIGGFLFGLAILIWKAWRSS